MESVSPKKTVVGFVSGILSSLIVSIIFALIINFENIFELILIGISISFIGSIGDLIESKFKRQFNISSGYCYSCKNTLQTGMWSSKSK